MFVRCFSDHVLEKQYRPAVFYIENTIRAILLEDFEDVANTSAEHLRELIFKLGRPIGFPKNCPEPKPSDEWIRAFVDREIPFLVSVVREPDGSKSSALLPNDPRIDINTFQLKECVRLDNGFRDFLGRSPRYWQG